MTIAAEGSYTVADDSTAGYTVVSAGTTGVTLLKLKFAATNEDIDIERVAFQLGSVASNTPLDLVGRKVTLWSGSTQIGEAEFSTSDYATSTLISTGSFRIPSGGTKTMTVKGDIAGISPTVGPIISSGDLLIVAYDGNANGSANGNYGKGVASGQTIDGTSSDVTPTGVRIMKSFPTFAHIALSSSEKLLQTVAGKTLYKFKVTASDKDVYMYKFTFNVSSSSKTATTSNFGLYAFTNSSYSAADTTFSTDGLLNADTRYTTGVTDNPVAGMFPIVMEDSNGTTTYKVPAGSSRWFELRADVASVESGTGTEYITVRLEGDAAFPVTNPGSCASTGANMGTATVVDGDTNDDLIWSPNSTSTTAAYTDCDFTNGYGIVGLPSTYMLTETLTSAN